MRVKRGTFVKKTHKKILKLAKGYKERRSKLFKEAKQAVIKAGMYAYRDRRKKKTEKKHEWHITINAGLREIDNNLSFSKFMHFLKMKNIGLDKKMLAKLAMDHQDIFKKLVEGVRV